MVSWAPRAPDPPMVGIRSPIGLVVGSCTSHPWSFGFDSQTRGTRKQAHPVLKFRVPHGSQCVMGSLVHTGLGSSSLVAHVLPYPPPYANTFVLGPAVINTHTRQTSSQRSTVHTGLGSQSLVPHVLHCPPPPREQVCNRYCSNKHTPVCAANSFII
jgi:hypothetical protein